MTAPVRVSFGRAATIDPFDLDRMDDTELDELPFGVICLDRVGTILRYNAAEARLARLDRHVVIGRNFFDRVAPCTKTPDFYGRFERMVSGETPEPIVRFEYLFDFKFGAQRVEIEMVRGPRSECFYLLVNRTQFEPPREGLETGFPAPRLKELHPPAADVGVLRDDYEQRVVHTPAAFFDALLRTCDRVAPETWAIFCHEWGVQWGRRAVVDMETASLERTKRSLRERPMQQVAERMVLHLREQGWGDLALDLSSADAGVLQMSLDNSALAAASRRVGGRRCHLIAGMLSALMTHLAGRRLHVEEVCCAGQGHPRCELVVVGETRRERVAAIAKGGSTVADVLHALEDSRHG